MPSIIASPTAGPSAIATAAARFSSTTGDGVMRWSATYSVAICGQSVSAAVDASSCRAAMAAWSWYGPGRRSVSVRCDEGLALGDPGVVPQRPVLVVEEHQLAGRSDPRVTPRVVEEHQGEEPARLRLVGEQRHDDPCQPDGLGTQLAPDRAHRPTTPRSPR